MLRIPALAKGIIVTERAIEWNFVCDYATSYQVTDETNMAPAPTISTPPSDNASRSSNGFHSNGFYDVKLRNVSSTDFTGRGDVGEEFLYVGETTNITFNTFSPMSRRSRSCMLAEVFHLFGSFILTLQSYSNHTQPVLILHITSHPTLLWKFFLLAKRNKLIEESNFVASIVKKTV